MDNIKESFETKHHIVKILWDEDPESPRTWDNAGKLICFHNKYDLGDKHNFDKDELEVAILQEYGKDSIVLPLSLYDHSDISIKAGSPTDAWDSGYVGFAVMSEKAIAEEWSGDYDKALACLHGEVETYDQYLRGDVTGFIVCNKYTGERVGSCWGFYGDDAIEEGRAVAEFDDKRLETDRHNACNSDARIQTLLGEHYWAIPLETLETITPYLSKGLDDLGVTTKEIQQ